MSASSSSLIVQFVSAEDGQIRGPQIELPAGTTVSQLQELVNKLLGNDDVLPYSFYVEGKEVVSALPKQGLSAEKTVEIVFTPQAVFRVRPVARVAGTLQGHTNSVVAVQFSADGSQLASASGDGTVRLWDLTTLTPCATCRGHRDWVLAVAWSPDGRTLASGSRDGEVRVWDAASAVQRGETLSGHRDFITALAWEPIAACDEPGAVCRRLASASKDGAVRVWDAVAGRCLFALGGHSQAVQCLRWSGAGFIYTGSRDRTINVYDASSGRLTRTLRGHAHWVNTMAVSSDFVSRTGPYDHTFTEPSSPEEGLELAKNRLRTFISQKATANSSGERLVTGSDDGTLILWNPQSSSKPLARMTGHQQQVMCVAFSPDGRFIASGGFDKSVRLWDGLTGRFISTLRGHVGAVYQIAWSPDSRLLVSASKDSTMKLWDLKTRTLLEDLPGHADEVFSVDWSPDGELVASGSFDRTLKIWRH